MTRRTAVDRTAATLRELDPAGTATLTEEERRRAEALLAQILAAPTVGPSQRGTRRPRRRRRALVPAALLTAGLVALSMALGGGSAFADWSAVPVTLPAAGATSCSTDPAVRVRA